MEVKFYETSTEVVADPAVVWSILIDAPAYSGWDSGVERVDGMITPGGTITVHSKVAPGRAFPVKVAFPEPGRTMTWSGGMPLGLFRGVRTFRLAPMAEGTSFSMREEFTGPMLGMIWKSMPDLGPSFEQFARGLKARAERA
jgi:hypothetical protein